MALFDVLRTSSSMIICDPGDFSSNLVVVRGLMGCDWCGYIYSGGFTVGQKAASLTQKKEEEKESDSFSRGQALHLPFSFFSAAPRCLC